MQKNRDIRRDHSRYGPLLWSAEHADKRQPHYAYTRASRQAARSRRSPATQSGRRGITLAPTQQATISALSTPLLRASPMPGSSFHHVARAHLALALAASLFGGLNVVIEIGLEPGSNATSTEDVKATIGRAAVFALYRDVGAALILGGAALRQRNVAMSAMRSICGSGRVMFMVFGCASASLEPANSMPFTNIAALPRLQVVSLEFTHSSHSSLASR